MTNSALQTDASPEFDHLPMTERLFLWTVRHVVCASEESRPVSSLVGQFYRDAGLPGMLPQVIVLLKTICEHASSLLIVNVPCGAFVLPDEQLLLRDLRQNERQRGGASAIACKLRPSRCDAIEKSLHDVARHLAALRSMEGQHPGGRRSKAHRPDAISRRSVA